MSVVYYKFKSAKDYDSVPVHGPFISVWNLKEKIFLAKHLARGTDFDLLLSNAQTNEDYSDEAMQIPRNTYVLVRRVAGPPRMRIVIEREKLKDAESSVDEVSQSRSTLSVADSSNMTSLSPNVSEEYNFGDDIFAIPQAVPAQSCNMVQKDKSNIEENKLQNNQIKAEEERKLKALVDVQAEEDRKIKAFVDTPSLDMQRKTKATLHSGGVFGKGVGGKMTEGHVLGRGERLERKTPPEGYICHRCQVPGHFIHHCPTNGDLSYHIKRLKHPIGIPKSMLMETPDGSYTSTNGAVAALKPNEAAFVKEIKGLPSAHSVSDLPQELHCPLCKKVMKDAVMTGKCCFRSFCDKCIRDLIISKSRCACGATNILADSLIPNRTLRETIDHILESTTSSCVENPRSCSQLQESNSSHRMQPNSSHTVAPVKKENAPASSKDGSSDRKRPAYEEKLAVDYPQKSSEGNKIVTDVEECESTLESAIGKEPKWRRCAPPLAEEKVKDKLPIGEPVKKKRKKGCAAPANAVDSQWGTSQDIATLNHFMPFGPSPYNPYLASMQWGVNESMVPSPYDPYWASTQCGLNEYMFP